MGKFEKIVVLAVLFLVTLILVVSLNTDEPEFLAHAAGGGDEEVTLEDPVEPASEPATTEWKVVDSDEPEPAVFDPPITLLSGRVEEEAPIVHAVMLPEGSILCDAVGLVETPDPAIFLHTVAEGETYESLAVRYYGDGSLSGMLRLANDEYQRDAPVNLASVLIPAFDRRVKQDNRRSGMTYTVKSGDTFTQISLDLYGDMNRWEEIYDANKELVSSPVGLRPDMILRIPWP